ncbi:hypothetical protein ACA373_21620 [Erwinia sp. STN24]|jgi:hypothetical protein|uniref:hypothetical protein n=1 Tax=Erwinia sp. STN24 TaxID=3233996 RepID=UPI00352302F2
MKKEAPLTIPQCDSFPDSLLTIDPLNESGRKQCTAPQLQTAEDALIKAYINYSASHSASQKLKILDEVEYHPVRTDMRHYRK